MPAPSPAAAPAAAASSAPTTPAAAAMAAPAASPAPTPAAAPATPKASTTRRPKNPYPMRKQPARKYEFRPPGPANVHTRVGPPPAMAEKGGGILIGLFGYALTIQYLKGGWTGVEQWLRAKFLNDPTQGPAVKLGTGPIGGGNAQKLGTGPIGGSTSNSTGGRKAA